MGPRGTGAPGTPAPFWAGSACALLVTAVVFSAVVRKATNR